MGVVQLITANKKKAAESDSKKRYNYLIFVFIYTQNFLWFIYMSNNQSLQILCQTQLFLYQSRNLSIQL